MSSEEHSSPYVPAIALLRVVGSMALEVKAEMMRCSNCTECYNSGMDWTNAEPGDYAELCPSRMASGKGTTPTCRHWPVCSDAIRLRYMTVETADLFVPVSLLSECREQVESHLLKQGAWRDTTGKPTPGRDSVMAFAARLLEATEKPQVASDNVLGIYQEIGGAYEGGGA